MVFTSNFFQHINIFAPLALVASSCGRRKTATPKKGELESPVDIIQEQTEDLTADLLFARDRIDRLEARVTLLEHRAEQARKSRADEQVLAGTRVRAVGGHSRMVAKTSGERSVYDKKSF